VRVAIIGGLGFIGRHLSRALRATGRDVIVLTRNAFPFHDDLDASIHRFSPEDPSSLLKLLTGCEEVIDLAYSTVPKSSFHNPYFDLQSNLPRFLTLLDAVRGIRNLRRFLVVSSGGTVYGPVMRTPIVEDTPTSPISPYGITKLTIERYSMMYHHLYGLPCILIRPSNAYGPGQLPFRGQGYIATAIGNIMLRSDVVIYGQRGTGRDYLHVRDLVDGIRAALEHGQIGEIYNVGSGIGHDNVEILELLRPIAHASGFDINARHESERKFDVPSNILNFGRLLACSRWAPKISIEDGLAEMWESMQVSLSIP